MNWLKKLVYRIGFTLFLDWGLYYTWSRLFRFLRQRKYKGDVPIRKTLREISDFMDTREWKKDTWREFGDAIGYPRYFEEVGHEGMFGLDCDEHSIWILNTAREGMEYKGHIWYPVGLLTVVWQKGKKLPGHNVGLFRCFENNKVNFAHFSNWGFFIVPHSTYEVVAFDVARDKGTLMGWRLTSSDLKGKVDRKIYV